MGYKFTSYSDTSLRRLTAMRDHSLERLVLAEGPTFHCH